MTDPTVTQTDDPTPPTTGLRVLKVVVAGLAALIVLGLILLVYGMIKKTSDPAWRLFGDAAPTTAGLQPAAAAKAFGDIRLPLPTGCAIADVDAAGDRVYVTGGPGADCAIVVIINAASGRVLGRYRADGP